MTDIHAVDRPGCFPRVNSGQIKASRLHLNKRSYNGVYLFRDRLRGYRMDEQSKAPGTDQNRQPERFEGAPVAQGVPAQTPYRRQRPHITQPPIDDAGTEYVMPERYITVDQMHNNRPRKHMGVATSDPEYLPPTGPTAQGTGYVPPSSPTLHVRSDGRGATKQPVPQGQPVQAGQLHYDRYLQTPKKGRSIFTSRLDRQRRKMKLLLAVLIIAAIVLAFVWFFVLR